MRKLLLITLALALFLPSVSFAAEILDIDPAKYVNNSGFLGYVPDRFIVVLKDGVVIDQGKDAPNSVTLSELQGFNSLAETYEVSQLRPQFKGADKLAPSPGKVNSELSRFYKVTFNAGTLMEVMAQYEALPDVERVEPIGIHTLYATPNDGYYQYQTYHYQANDHDIDSDEAWDLESGSDAVIVALLDSGTRYYHPDLGGVNASPTTEDASRGNIWINWDEKNGTAGVDDDGNGYVDDWIGYDFIETTTNCWDGEDCGTADNDPRDFNGHGTHTAGIIGMLTNDGYGMAGTAGGWNDGTQPEIGNGVKVMPLRMGYSYRYGSQEYGVVLMDAAAEAFYYAAENGAKIASCSWGSSNSGGIGAAIDYFLNAGGMIFVAAGNDGTQTADYMNGRGDLVSVAAVDVDDSEASFTTYGTWVDISAPGVTIYSTYHDHSDPSTDYWAAMDGTSMATPMAAAVGALIWSHNPSWTASEVESQLYSSADNIDAYLSSTYIGKMGAGRINSYNAVNTGTTPPVAAFIGSPTSGTEPLTVNFTDQSTGTVSSWDWDFGDGGSSTAQNPTYEYTSAGTYNVTLTVTGPGGTDDEIKTDYIMVNPCVAPTAGFAGSPTSGDYPLTVDFTDQSSDAESYSWDFGDGGSSTEANPSYTYIAAGTFTVTQTVTNSCGSDQLVRTDHITVTEAPPPPPTADFVGSPTSGDYPLTVNFTDLSTDGPTSWSWDFGDGVGTSTLQNPSYTYTEAGTYTVSLTATNAYGSDVETKLGYIYVSEPGQSTNAYPLSDISVTGSVSGGYANTYASDNVYETITEVAYTGHPRKTYSYLEHKWDFNLGSGGSTVIFYLEAYRTDNSDGDNFTFAYSTDDVTYTNMVTVSSAVEEVYTYSISGGASGTLYVRVIDTDRNWGNSSNDAINIDEMYFEYESTPTAPTADFTASPTSGVYPLDVTFTDLSTGTPTSWNWDFGDGGGSTDQHPSYTYNNIGTYTVTLTVSNDYGSDDIIKTDYITVTDIPSGDIHVADMMIGRSKVGPNYVGTCTVTIEDNTGLAVSDVTVYVTATGPTGGNYSGVTGADGTVYFETSGMKKPSGEWCFEVTDVVHATLPYDSDDNAVTQACESGWVYGNYVGSMIADQFEADKFAIAQNHPNPFNPITKIMFNLPEASHVRLDIFNILGQRVETLVDEYRDPGIQNIIWDASDQASGIYLYRITTQFGSETKRMVLMK